MPRRPLRTSGNVATTGLYRILSLRISHLQGSKFAHLAFQRFARPKSKCTGLQLGAIEQNSCGGGPERHLSDGVQEMSASDDAPVIHHSHTCDTSLTHQSHTIDHTTDTACTHGLHSTNTAPTHQVHTDHTPVTHHPDTTLTPSTTPLTHNANMAYTATTQHLHTRYTPITHQ